MTALTRKVRRSVKTRRSEYVVTLHPGTPSLEPIIEVREKRTRLPYFVGVGALYSMLALKSAGITQRNRRTA